MSFWPKKIEFQEIIINSLWSFIAWIVWSFLILIITFLLWSSINIVWTFDRAVKIGVETSSIFPLVLSIITLIWSTLTIYLTYKLLVMTSEKKYKNNIVILWQIMFFALITYFFVTPIYIFAWIIDYNYIMYVFFNSCFDSNFLNKYYNRIIK